MSVSELNADDVIRLLELQPHPEGGHFREIHRAMPPDGGDGRGVVTSIYFLLAAGQRSHWHRVDATEIWYFHAGAPLRLEIADTLMVTAHILGPDLMAGERPQAVVPPSAWQAAESVGDWTLVGCTVAPAFDFAGFELAPPDWSPGV